MLVALLAIQLPKLLGGSSSPEAAPVDRDDHVPAAPTAGELRSRSSEAAPTPAGDVREAHVLLRLRGEGSVRPAGRDPERARSGSRGRAKGAGEGATKAGTSPSEVRTGAKAAAVTIVTVNGARQVLEPGMKFPAADPLFVLVAEKPGSKSVVVGIVGGAYSGGAKTTTLKIGKPLTLVNTTTGARYKISLVSVGSGEQAEQPAAQP